MKRFAKRRFLLIVAIAALAFAGLQLALNYQHAQTLQKAVLAADKKSADATLPLAELHDFVATHQNASVDFVREDAYQHALDATQPQVDSAVYAQAQAACPSKADSITQANCITGFLASHTAPASQTPPPNHADYVVNFHSPAFALDAAGLALIVSAGAAILFGWFWLVARI